MTKFLRRFAVVVSVPICLFLLLAVCGHVRLVDARLTGVNPTGASADIWCVGPTGAEVCVDYLGDFLPTTTNDTTLGTTALRWANVYSTLYTGTTATFTTLNATTVAAGSGGVTNTGPTQLATNTTTQLALRADAVGSTYLAQERVAGVLVTNTYNLCSSTAANVASYVYIAVSTSAQAVAGAACAN